MIFRTFIRFYKNRDGLAATEFALILPLLLILLTGMIDLGNGMMTKKKTVGASQIVGDLLTRTATVTQEQIDDAVYAGGLAMAPYPVADYGVDIVSVEFAGEPPAPQIVWRETVNMTPDPDILSRVTQLNERGEGVLVVNATYKFNPLFVGFAVKNIILSEYSFSRGRRSSVVRKE